MDSPFISFRQVVKRFGALTVVDHLDLDITRGEFIALLGPSGSGKTTLLMMLAGFEQPSGGTIMVDGQRVDGLPPHKRNMGVVFQNYALFPHMSVRDNIAFPLKMRNTPRDEIATRVARVLDMVKLSAMAERKPAQLSGGQQQRVALARALVFEPKVVLMDEPLGALDKKLREQMQLDIRDLHRRLGLTIVFVTHDQDEALTMSDRIAVFNHGRIEQIGPPREIYELPRTPFVAEFIGETNLLPCKVAAQAGEAVHLTTASGLSLSAHAGAGRIAGADVQVSIRPEAIRINDHAAATANRLTARIMDAVYFGDHMRLVAEVGAQRLIIKGDRMSEAAEVGSEVALSFAASDVWVVGSCDQTSANG
ncbi:polyamine-transporting ATPase [Bradyrhizobium sp. SSBR45G]|uniref:ABC transporter ATP-binding protein n=1 Tax=unclassified Bradyrhizobium TaxID=2631580 RepID=UPI0023429848|nr:MULTISPECIES: ABC transporter ATP-binding protein [unclassified Bradyrhizobium]GLH82284.1 polyamine-transporting ATPase [Bradyrhizobium sp. SSBR45G]GLH88261.1 polyamine-transporting ATPase [Bradyrhizobium sp. SSBR45R]